MRRHIVAFAGAYAGAAFAGPRVCWLGTWLLWSRIATSVLMVCSRTVRRRTAASSSGGKRPTHHQDNHNQPAGCGYNVRVGGGGGSRKHNQPALRRPSQLEDRSPQRCASKRGKRELEVRSHTASVEVPQVPGILPCRLWPSCRRVLVLGRYDIY